MSSLLSCSVIPLKDQIAILDEKNSSCSACNIVAAKFDDVIQDAKLIKGWTKWTPQERAVELRQVLKRACPKIAQMDIYAGGNKALGTRVYIDVTETKKQGAEVVYKMLSDMDPAPEHKAAVKALCDAAARDASTIFSIAERMDLWKRAKKKRRLVDYRFKEDNMCVSVLSVCQAEKPVDPASSEEEEDDDEREL